MLAGLTQIFIINCSGGNCLILAQWALLWLKLFLQPSCHKLLVAYKQPTVCALCEVATDVAQGVAEVSLCILTEGSLFWWLISNRLLISNQRWTTRCWNDVIKYELAILSTCCLVFSSTIVALIVLTDLELQSGSRFIILVAYKQPAVGSLCEVAYKQPTLYNMM